MTKIMTKAGEGTKKEPVAASSEKKFLRDKYTREIAHWKRAVKGFGLALAERGNPTYKDDIKQYEAIARGYEKSLVNLEKARQKLREVEASE